MHEQETGGNHVVRTFIIELLSKQYSGLQIMETDMNGACSMYCRKEKYIQNDFVLKPDRMRPLGECKQTGKGS
jgi:hypothetical protein